jgi:hypothetical protein
MADTLSTPPPTPPKSGGDSSQSGNRNAGSRAANHVLDILTRCHIVIAPLQVQQGGKAIGPGAGKQVVLNPFVIEIPGGERGIRHVPQHDGEDE